MVRCFFMDESRQACISPRHVTERSRGARAEGARTITAGPSGSSDQPRSRPRTEVSGAGHGIGLVPARNERAGKKLKPVSKKRIPDGDKCISMLTAPSGKCGDSPARSLISPTYHPRPCCYLRYRSGRPTGDRLKAGLGHEPFTVQSIAGRLPASSILRVRVQQVAVVAHLASVGIRHNAKLSR